MIWINDEYPCFGDGISACTIKYSPGPLVYYDKQSKQDVDQMKFKDVGK